MKFLLAIAMTMVLMGSAFGACSKDSLKECTESECKKLSVSDGIQYNMEKTTDGPLCRLKETAIATNCTENSNDGRKSKLSTTDDKTGAGAPGTIQK